MNAGFQLFFSPDGNAQVVDGVVIQPKTGVVIEVGNDSYLAGRQDAEPSSLTAAVAAAAATAVGGSGRNLVATGLTSMAGFYSPTVPDVFRSGAFTLEVTGPSAATISDGTDIVAELTTGGTAPVGNYDSTAYGETEYNGGTPFVLAMAEEEGAPGAIPDVLVTISAGTAVGGIYTATDAINFVSSVDPDWTLAINPDGTAELRYLGTAVAIRAEGEAHDPQGRFVAEPGAYFYNPLPLDGEDPLGSDVANPFGVLTLVFTWPATPDLDIGVTFQGVTMGYGHGGSSPYMTWSGDDTSPAGSETVVIDLAQAWADGVISSVAEIGCAADWYPTAGGTGLATLGVGYTVGSYSDTLSISPGGATPATSAVASLRILAAGTVDNAVGVWQAHVRTIGRVPRAGFAYLEVIEVAGVLDAVNGPFYATTVPASAGSTYYFPLAKSDGTKVTQYHTGALPWP